MRSIYSLLGIVIFCGFFFTSCKTPEKVIYFEENPETTVDTETEKRKYSPIFKVDDALSITVSALDMDAARPFNLGGGTSLDSSGSGGESGGSSTGQPTYLVDPNGDIEFPVLGRVKIAGLTNIEVKEMLKTRLIQYIKDPIVNVRLTNFKITVLGEVGQPGAYFISNDRVTILEAIGLASDLTIKGRRDNILVIRENAGTNSYYRIDMNSKSVFNSPAYYLAQNDVIYVEPNESQIKKSGDEKNVLGIVLSIVGISLSALTFAFTVTN